MVNVAAALDHRQVAGVAVAQLFRLTGVARGNALHLWQESPLAESPLPAVASAALHLWLESPLAAAAGTESLLAAAASAALWLESPLAAAAGMTESPLAAVAWWQEGPLAAAAGTESPLAAVASAALWLESPLAAVAAESGLVALASAAPGQETIYLAQAASAVEQDKEQLEGWHKPQQFTTAAAVEQEQDRRPLYLLLQLGDLALGG